jgi:hypothetical protein
MAYCRLDKWNLVPNMGKVSSCHHFIETGSEIDTASFPVDTGSSFPRIKRLEHEVHLLACSVELRISFCYTLSVLYMKYSDLFLDVTPYSVVEVD